MKIHSIDQTIKCGQCRSQYPLLYSRRLMNFTSGEITFFCKNCRTKIAYLPFSRWNSLHRAYLGRPPAPRPENRPPQEQGRRSRNRSRDRSRRFDRAGGSGRWSGPRPVTGSSRRR